MITIEIEKIIGNIVKNILKEQYPHTLTPATILARIVSKKTEVNYFEYTLKIIDKRNQEDRNYTEIPGVISKLNIDIGKTVAAALLQGELNPFILGEVVND